MKEVFTLKDDGSFVPIETENNTYETRINVECPNKTNLFRKFCSESGGTITKERQYAKENCYIIREPKNNTLFEC